MAKNEPEEEDEENDILAKLNKLRSQQFDVPSTEHNSRKIVPASPPNAEYTPGHSNKHEQTPVGERRGNKFTSENLVLDTNDDDEYTPTPYRHNKIQTFSKQEPPAPIRDYEKEKELQRKIDHLEEQLKKEKSKNEDLQSTLDKKGRLLETSERELGEHVLKN